MSWSLPFQAASQEPFAMAFGRGGLLAKQSLAPLALVLAVACGSASEEEKPAEDVEAKAAPAIDAAPEPPKSPITAAPASGTHLDGSGYGYKPQAGYVPRNPTGKTVELVLRSTPPGATASIDGQAIGVTPTFWSGPADQRAHDFTFVKEGHSMARYRFVATHSGVVHGNLSKLQPSDEEGEQPAK